MFRYEDNDGGERQECPICGRRFNFEAFQKHSKICKKVFASKRKPFDSKKHRIIDGEHAQLIKHQEFMNKKYKNKGMNININVKPKKKDWKLESEQFRAVIKNNRNMSQGKTGVYIPSQVPSDYVHCQYCNRNYNQQAYHKHLNYCQRKYKDSQLNMGKKQFKATGKPTTNYNYRKKY